MAAPTTGLTIIKRFPYRGDANEEYSNKYLLTGTTPADSTAWRALFDAVVAEEKKLYPSNTSVIAGYGYDSPSDTAHAIWSVDLTVSPNSPVAGTYTGGGIRAPGDSAVWVRWGLDRLNSKGKRVFLRKYFHPAPIDTVQNSGNGGDAIMAAWVTAATAFGAFMDGGTLLGSRKVTDRLGTITVGHAVSTWVTTRSLKRRGKRPN